MSEKEHPVVLRVEPVREGNLTGIERHVNRTSRIPAPNVDPNRTHLNRVIFGSSEIVKDAIGMAALYPPAHFDSTLLWAEMQLTANADWFNKLAPKWRTGDLGEKGEAWLAANLAWLEKQYPGLINVTLHLDEGAPHLHVLLCPVTTYEQGYRHGSHEVTKVNYRRIFSDDIRLITAARRNNKSSDLTKLGKLQSKYSEVMKDFGLVRGRRNSKGRHITPAEHRKRINQELPISPPPPFTDPEPRSIGPFGNKAAVERWMKDKEASETQRTEYLATLEAKARELEFMTGENERLRDELREKDAREQKLLADLQLAKEKIDSLRAIPLEQIAARLAPEIGPVEVTDGTGRPRWKGSIDMLKDAVGFTYREAVVWLHYEFGSQAVMTECLHHTEPNINATIKGIQKSSPSHPKTTLREELERFKSEINLVEIAVSLGYVKDHKESWKNGTVMRGPDGNKIIIATNADTGHAVYWSAHDALDKGSVVDFVQRRKGINLGEIRKELRGWLDSATRPQVTGDYDKPIPTTKDEQAVLRSWQAARPILNRDCGFLESRGITYDDLRGLGIHDVTKIDARGNILFGHYDDQGLIGYEAKNTDFLGSRGNKGLWGAGGQSDEVRRIVVCESAIDAISYSKLFPDKEAVYLSFAGTWNRQQPVLLKQWFEQHFPQAEIVAAVDNDLAGDEYVLALDSLAPGRVRRHSPEIRGKDWNDILMEKLGLRVPAATPVKGRAVAGPGR